MGFGALKLVLLIGVLHGAITLAAASCKGVCVRMDECENTFGGINLVNLRFSDDDYEEAECPHYLDICCDAEHVVTTPAPPPPDNEKSSQEHFEIHQGENQHSEVTSEVAVVKEDSGEGKGDSENVPVTTTTEASGVVDDTETRGGAGEERTFNECGLRNPNGVVFQLENPPANETQFAEFPWMVAVLEYVSEPGHATTLGYPCGGSLIAPNVVLTVAHCVMDKEAKDLFVRAGEWDTRTENEPIPYQERKVSSIILHPKLNRQLLFNNLALLVLEEPFTPADNVQLACLPPQDAEFTNDNCFAAGWGKTNFDSNYFHAILKRISLPMVSREQCQTALRTTKLGNRFRLHESYICAGGEEGIDTCTGDGGSPLVCPVEGTENKYYQAGIVAWGINCGQAGIPGVYVKTSQFTKWIDSELLKINFGSVNRRTNV